MPTSFTLRAMTPDDSYALATLTDQSPDGGTITFRPRFHLPAYQVFATRHHNMLGVVAEAPRTAGLVGAGHVSFGECRFEGQMHPYALLSALMVHPDFRRQGIAAALAQWRVERAVEHAGSDVLLLAAIQAGNIGSTANAKKWASQIGGRFVTNPVPMRSQPSRINSDLIVRPAKPTELEHIVQQLNTFYQDYNFYRPETVDTLQAWLTETPFTAPVNHYLVVTDRSDRLLAGMGIKEEGRLMSVYVEKVPPVINILNYFLKVIPADHEMRNLDIEKMWFAPGQLEAARYLWQTARYEWRDRGSSLLCQYDPLSPIQQVLQTPSWMPTTNVSLALRSQTPMDETRLIAPIV